MRAHRVGIAVVTADGARTVRVARLARPGLASQAIRAARGLRTAVELAAAWTVLIAVTAALEARDRLRGRR